MFLFGSWQGTITQCCFSSPQTLVTLFTLMMSSIFFLIGPPQTLTELSKISKSDPFEMQMQTFIHYELL